MTHIDQRRSLASQWTSDNPVLQRGELGWETDTLSAKLGDGVTAWNDLPYAVQSLNPSLYATLASPEFTGNPKAPTPLPSDNDTSIATTAFVQAQKVSPVFTGDPKAPTPATSDSDTSIATTEFVKNQGYGSAVLFVTSTTRPASPPNGTRIYETDTGNYLIYYTSVTAWRYIGNRAICTSSTRPTGSTLVEGLTIYETDTTRTYTRISGVWVQTDPVGELGYAEVTSNWTSPTPTAFTDVPGLSVTVNVGTRPIQVDYQCAMQHVLSGGGYLVAAVRQSATVLQRAFSDKADARLVSVTGGVRLTPSPGSRTYKISLLTEATGGAGITLSAAADYPSWIRVTEL